MAAAGVTSGYSRWFQLIYCLSYGLKLRFKFCAGFKLQQLHVHGFGHEAVAGTCIVIFCMARSRHFPPSLPTCPHPSRCHSVHSSSPLLTIFFALKLSSSLYSFLSVAAVVSRWIPEPVVVPVIYKSTEGRMILRHTYVRWAQKNLQLHTHTRSSKKHEEAFNELFSFVLVLVLGYDDKVAFYFSHFFSVFSFFQLCCFCFMHMYRLGSLQAAASIWFLY